MLKGVTLIELVILILVVSIISIALVARINPVSSSKIAGAGERLTVDLNNARRLAMAEHRVYEVRFTDYAYRVGYLDYDTGEFTDVPCPHTGSERYVMDFSAEGGFTGVKIESVDFDGTDRVRFGSFGMPFDGTGGELTADGRVILGGGGEAILIKVVQGTGSIFREK